MAQARLESSREKEATASSSSSSVSPEKETALAAENSFAGGENSTPVVIRQRSITPRSKRVDNNRLSYIDNEIRFLDAEQLEIDRQAAILDKRLR